MKIAVLGYSGAGKSTLAKRLGACCQCPVFYLDSVQFTANWQERDRAEAYALAAGFLEQPAWIIDGNYEQFCQARRLEEAEKIILLLLPRWLCFYRVCRRYWKNRNRTRESMAAGCEEKLDWEFIRWVLWQGRTKEHRAHFQEIAARYSWKCTVIKKRAQVRAFFEEFENCEKTQAL